jgi:hypothetical protein
MPLWKLPGGGFSRTPGEAAGGATSTFHVRVVAMPLRSVGWTIADWSVTRSSRTCAPLVVDSVY